MKKFRLWVTALLATALCAFLFAACSSGVSLDKTELTLKVGQSETLTASAPEDALLSWSSSDETIATVSDGTVTAVAEGSATITVRAMVGEAAYTAQCSVTVTAADNVTVTFVADGVTVDTLEVAYGGSVSADQIPAVPEKSGYAGSWSMTAEELTDLRADVTVTAEYARIINYTVTVYTQQEDLTYTAGEPQTLSAAEGTTVSADPAAPQQGYFVDMQKSVLSATLAEGTELKIYYSLEYNSVYVRRADNTSVEYRVYASGIVADAEGVQVEDFDETFALTENSAGQYYFWNIGSVIVERALTKEDFTGAEDGTIILESRSTDAIYNTAGNSQGATVNSDGTVTMNPTGDWLTGTTPGYVYFIGSSDTFYAKVKVTPATASSDISVGFVLSDAEDPEKNVQFYFNGNGSNRELFQNNSWGWDPGYTRTLYSDTAAAFAGNSNELEIVVADGYVWFWLNGNYFCSASIDSLEGYGNVAGLFADTEVFNLGIAQWRFNKPVVTFSETEFLYGDEAAEKIAERALTVSFAAPTVDVDLSDASTLQLALISNGGTTVDLSGATFESDKTDVVTVDRTTGKLTPVGAGTAVITATVTISGEQYTATCSVTVKTWTVTFMADGKTVEDGTLTVINGGSISAEQIPAVPEKSGFAGAWDKSVSDLSAVKQDITVNAVYSTSTIAYTVEIYTQQNDLTYSRTDTKELSGVSGSSVSYEPEQAAEGYFLNTELSVLSATLTEGTVLKVYYSLEYGTVTVQRATGSTEEYSVYANGIVTDEDGTALEEDDAFELIADGEGVYYFWNVGGKIVRRALTKTDIVALGEGTIVEQSSTSSLFNSNSAKDATLNGDGTVTMNPTSDWGTGITPGYIYFLGSSDTLYAKVKVTSATANSDISVGFVLSDAEDPDKNVQLYFNGDGSNRQLFQNNSWGWDPGYNRTLYSDKAAVFAGDTNVLEIAVADGYVWFWLNGNYFCSASIDSLEGLGNVAGLFADTEVFNLGIAQWRFNKPVVTFSEITFLAGDDASETIADRMPAFSLGEGELEVDPASPETLQLTLTSSYGDFLDLSSLSVEWESKEPSIVTVENGTLVPVNKGKTTVTATVTLNGKQFTAEREVNIVAVYNGLYTVEYYRQNALTKEYDLVDKQENLPAEEDTVSVSPAPIDNYQVAEQSVLSATLEGGTATLKVYYELLVASVKVTITQDETPKDYTAYYAIGLYDGEKPVADFSGYAWESGYLWKMNDTYRYSLTNDAFTALTQETTAEKLSVSEIGKTTVNQEDMKDATVNEDGSVDMTVPSGAWEGAYAYFTGSGTEFYMQTVLRETGNPASVNTDICAGFTVKGSDGSSFQIYVSWKYSNFRINWGHVWNVDGSFGDSSAGSWIVNGLPDSESYLNGNGATLGLGYADGMFYIYVDGSLCYSFAASALTFNGGTVSMGTGWTVGFASWSANKANFSDYYVVFGDFEAPVAQS